MDWLEELTGRGFGRFIQRVEQSGFPVGGAEIQLLLERVNRIQMGAVETL